MANEGPGVKLSIWLLTAKRQKSLWLFFVKWRATYHWKALDKGYNFAYLNRRFSEEVMGFQSRESPNFKNFGTPNLGVPWQDDIWVLAPWLGTKNIMRKVVGCPKFGLWWVLWVRVCPWFICAPKMLQLCINQLVVWFV
jgi:hypothetical protein